MSARNANRIQKVSSWLAVLGLVAVCFSLAASRSEAADTPRTTGKLLVKVRAPLAKSIESALPLQTMQLVAGQTGNAQIDRFLARYSVRRARPLYPDIVRLKKERGLTDLQIAATVRQRFDRRAARLHAAFQPPEISRTYIFELDLSAAQNLGSVLSGLQADRNVEFAEEEKVAATNFIPNDPYFSSYGSWGQPYYDLWGVRLIGSSGAWDTSTGAGVIVAVVDTGIDFTHPDIIANIWTNTGEIPNNGIDDDHNGYIDDVHGWDFIGSSYMNPVQSNNPVDHFGHGTHVSGTIAAVGNNGVGVIGVAWNAQIMPVKGLDDNGNGIDSTLGPALIYAANNGADVISNSWAGQGNSQTIADAVSYAYNLGAVIVAAAGNNSDDARKYYPANLPQVITVAATDHNNTMAYFSNWGSKIDVTAPGVDVLSLRAAGTTLGTPVDAYYTRLDGTSMATPHVSGLAGLLLSQNPAYSNEDVRQAIRVSATKYGTAGFDLNYGYGVINAAAALTLPDVVEAKILSPADGTHVNSPATISGVARGSAFAQYKLEYGSGQTPTNWTLIQSGTSPVAGGSLGVFDPSTVPDGIYVIRLTAYDLSNTAFTDRIELSVNYLSITSPPPPTVPVVAAEFKPGTQLSITGTATGASFQDFRIDWAEGIYPSAGWNNVGIGVAGSGASPVINGTLGTWNTSTITTADYYTLRLSVDDAGFTSTAFTLVYFEPSLISQNWPIALDEGTYWSSGIVPATDAAGNQKLTLVGAGTTTPSEYKTFSPDGATQTSTSLTYYGSLFQPATGDLDGNPGDEAAMTDVLMLRVFRGDNSSYTLTPAQTADFTYSQVVLEDLNNDSQLEIVALGEDYNVPNAYVYAYLRSGQQLNANFPITIANQNTNIDTYTKGNRLFVGDIDGDGNREILVLEGTTASTFTPRLFANDGTPKTWSAPSYSGYPDQLVLADLDHNGTLETIFTCSCNSEKELHVLQPNGTERAGWPVILQAYADNISYIAVGDINKDGREEIVVSIGTEIFVLEDNGTSFSSSWPIVGTGYASFGPVVLADINGDGLPEILTSEYAVAFVPNPLLPGASVPYNAPQIVAFGSNASVVRSWNMLGASSNQPDYMAKLTVGDFNKDGITDIAATYWTIEGGGMGGWLKEGVATVLSTGTPYNPQANDWPMIYQNPRNTAVLIRDHTPPHVSITSPSSGATLTGQVTVTANAWDNVMVTGVQFQLDGANLGPIDTTAPFSVVWDTTQTSQGSHTLTAVATDGAGNSAVSSPVTVTVAPPTTLTTATSSPNPSTYGQAVTFTSTTTSSGGVPTGTVTFTEGATVWASNVAVNGSGQASFSTAALTVGSHTITATFTGASGWANSSGSAPSQVVNNAVTTTTATSSPNPSTYGQAVTFTSTITSSGGVPVGTVTFTEGTKVWATNVAVNGSGQASFSISALTVGSHTITATFTGASGWGNSSGNAAPQVVNNATSTTAASSPNPSVFGQLVTFTSTTTSSGGVPAGTVTFTEGSTVWASNVTVNGSGHASFSTTALTVGSHVITATFTGSSGWSNSSGNTPSQVVNSAATTTAVSSSANPAVYGQPVTFTATVTATAPGSGVPMGTVTFKNGGSTLGTGTLNGSGVATLTTSALAVGSASITAVYGGSANFNASTSSNLNQTVNKDNTTATISSSANPSVYGQLVTFTATVTATAPGSGVPTGTVTFKNGGSTLGTGTLNGSGVATFTTSTLAVGSASITANYGGSSSFNASNSSNLNQTVNKDNTASVVSSSANPALYSQPVTFTATVTATAPGSGVPTGTVTFKNGGSTLGTGTLNGSGVATLTTSTLAVGSASITANYGGSNSFNASTSSNLNQTVNQDSTTSTVTSSQNPSKHNQSVTFTATVAANAPGTATPTGTVTFKDGMTTLGNVSLNSGKATLNTSTLSSGTHQITVVYGGSSSFLTSTSPVLVQTVN